jgi:hypothetical protein
LLTVQKSFLLVSTSMCVAASPMMAAICAFNQLLVHLFNAIFNSSGLYK